MHHRLLMLRLDELQLGSFLIQGLPEAAYVAVTEDAEHRGYHAASHAIPLAVLLGEEAHNRLTDSQPHRGGIAFMLIDLRAGAGSRHWLSSLRLELDIH
jgi:hypothetical protein